MSHEVVILSGADEDMLRKYIELDTFSEELADSFAADTQEALHLIGHNPFIGSAHSHPPFRKWLLLAGHGHFLSPSWQPVLRAWCSQPPAGP